MLQSLGWAALGTGFTFGMTTLGAAMVFFLSGAPCPRFQKALLGFAAGVMTAASVWSLLLPAMERTESLHIRPLWLPAAAGMLLGVLFLAAIGAMRLSGSVKENFFHGGSRAAEKFEVENAAPQENVWDQLTEKQEDRK